MDINIKEGVIKYLEERKNEGDYVVFDAVHHVKEIINGDICNHCHPEDFNNQIISVDIGIDYLEGNEISIHFQRKFLNAYLNSKDFQNGDIIEIRSIMYPSRHHYYEVKNETFNLIAIWTRRIGGYEEM